MFVMRVWNPGKTPLAWRNIVHKKRAAVISVAAVTFAILIMFMEMGFLNGLYDSQTALMNNLRADLVMVSSAMHNLVTQETFKRDRLEQAAAFDGVRQVCPVYIEAGISYIKHPVTGMENAIRVIGFDLDQPVFLHREILRQKELLRCPENVLFDVQSRRYFGKLKKGDRTELAGRDVGIAGTFSMTSDYYYDGNMVTSDETFFRVFPNHTPDRVDIGLIQLKPWVWADTVKKKLQAMLPDDVEVMTKKEIIDREKIAWRKSTPAGYVFGMGVIVGFIIGVIICYQILYTDIVDQMRQLATMKALGYHDSDLTTLVLQQAMILGLLGFVPAVVLTFGLYGVLTAITGIVMRLTVGRVIFMLMLTIGMCLLSGILAVRKVIKADPAELF